MKPAELIEAQRAEIAALRAELTRQQVQIATLSSVEVVVNGERPELPTNSLRQRFPELPPASGYGSPYGMTSIGEVIKRLPVLKK